MVLTFSTIFVVYSTLSLADSVRLDRNINAPSKVINSSDVGLEPIEQLIARNGFSTPEECKRTCRRDNVKHCYYRFHVELYAILGSACEICNPINAKGCQCIIADGVERSAYTVNRMIPGPTIEVCKGDTVHIDLVNLMPEYSVTIHWHGILQHNTTHFDGVPFVSQCPILPGTTFRYTWKANDAGTHFWHSHVGLQKMDGVSGGIVIRQPVVDDPYPSLFDKDETIIFVEDWMNGFYLDHRFPGRRFSQTGQAPLTLLINGHGNFRNPLTDTSTDIALAEFKVRQGHRYRFRLINALASICPIQIMIENHNLIIIGTDGHFVKPSVVDSIISASAERFDFVVTTNRTVGTYWIQIKALEGCTGNQLQQVAILKYVGGPAMPSTPRPTYNEPLPTTRVLNPLDPECIELQEDTLCISQLKSNNIIPSEILGKVDKQIYIGLRVSVFGLNFYEQNTYYTHSVLSSGSAALGKINNITFQSPPSALPSQFYDVDERQFCDSDNLGDHCDLNCKCTQVIDIPFNRVIELVLVDEVNVTGIHHPFHLHGFAFYVLGTGSMYPLSANVNSAIHMDKQGKLKRRFDRPPLKDTIMIPRGGYIVIRFLSNNPGFWFFHCHFLTHLITGMEGVLRVGSMDQLHTPYGFPKCGHYTPKL